MKKIFIPGLLSFLFTSTLLAQEAHDFHKHHAEAFLGGAKEYRDQEETTHVVGVEYQYRISELWAVGCSFEALGHETSRDKAFVATGTIYATDHWPIFAGPGYEGHAAQGAYVLSGGPG